MHDGTSDSLENKVHSNGYRLATMKIYNILSMKIKFILVEWSTEYEAGKICSEIYCSVNKILGSSGGHHLLKPSRLVIVQEKRSQQIHIYQWIMARA